MVQALLVKSGGLKIGDCDWRNDKTSRTSPCQGGGTCEIHPGQFITYCEKCLAQLTNQGNLLKVA